MANNKAPLGREDAIAGWEQVEKANHLLCASLSQRGAIDAQAALQALDMGARPRVFFEKQTETLSELVETDDIELMSRMLDDPGNARLSSVDRLRIMHALAHKGSAKLVRACVGSQIFTKDNLFEGLQIAVDRDRVDVAEILLDGGAPVAPTKKDDSNVKRLGWIVKSPTMFDLLSQRGYEFNGEDFSMGALLGQGITRNQNPKPSINLPLAKHMLAHIPPGQMIKQIGIPLVIIANRWDGYQDMEDRVEAARILIKHGHQLPDKSEVSAEGLIVLLRAGFPVENAVDALGQNPRWPQPEKMQEDFPKQLAMVLYPRKVLMDLEVLGVSMDALAGKFKLGKSINGVWLGFYAAGYTTCPVPAGSEKLVEPYQTYREEAIMQRATPSCTARPGRRL